MQCSSISHPTNPIFAAANTLSHSFVKHNSKCCFPVAAQFNRFQLKKSVANNLPPRFLVTNKENPAARLFPISTSTRVFSMSKSEATSSENENRSMIDSFFVQGLRLDNLEATSECFPNQKLTSFTVDGLKIFHSDSSVGSPDQTESNHHTEIPPNHTPPPHTSEDDASIGGCWAVALIALIIQVSLRILLRRFFKWLFRF